MGAARPAVGVLPPRRRRKCAVHVPNRALLKWLTGAPVLSRSAQGLVGSAPCRDGGASARLSRQPRSLERRVAVGDGVTNRELTPEEAHMFRRSTRPCSATAEDEGGGVRSRAVRPPRRRRRGDAAPPLHIPPRQVSCRRARS